uniref:Metacaspase-1 n=1 Tax=Blastobotrys adeninivorans TaxID=409370 RepID=A0A060T8P4_BLAAD
MSGYGYGSGYNQGYNGYPPPQGPPPGAYQGGYNYGPPQGPPPGAYGQGYGPPPGPPPGQHHSSGGVAGFPGSGGNTYGGHSPHPGANMAPAGGSGMYGHPGGPPANHHVGGIQDYGGARGRPPTGMQQYGNGQSFQYSNCTGRKKALCIGINYTGSKNALRGCINDARAMAAYLKDRHGYRDEDMVILTDDQRDQRSLPTKANILRAMQWLVAGAQTNDTLFFHYSGHGGQTQDLDGDEDDGYDEVIYPLDFQQAGHIVDDQMHEIMVRPLMPGVRLTALFDSCHSGTVLDIPYVYSTQGVIKEPNLLKDAGTGALSALNSYAQGNIGGVFKTVSGLVKKATVGNRAEQITRQTRTSPADVIQIAGCRDDQTSADAQNAGTNTGAMSYAFITVMTQNPNQSYISLLNEMRGVMRGRYTQKPQLSSSHPIDVNLQFIM